MSPEQPAFGFGATFTLVGAAHARRYHDGHSCASKSPGKESVSLADEERRTDISTKLEDGDGRR